MILQRQTSSIANQLYTVSAFYVRNAGFSPMLLVIHQLPTARLSGTTGAMPELAYTCNRLLECEWNFLLCKL